ncbi:unnamed protein product, partial [Symbiodinium necroappetens]
DVVYVDYGERPIVVHTRVVLAPVDEGNHLYMILTPDLDIYAEILHDSNPDFTRFLGPGPRGGIPRGVSARNVYGFSPMTAAQLGAYIQQGREEARAERVRLGLDGGHAAPAAPALRADEAGNRFWVLAEMVEGRRIGERVDPTDDAPSVGDWGLMNLDVGGGITRPCLIHRLSAEDLGSFCDERIRLARLSEAVDGDVTATIAESCYGQHLAWAQQSRIPEGSRAIYEDETLARIMDIAISYDSLNVCNLACFELLVRRRQLIAEAHSHNPSAPSYEGADYWLGTLHRPGGAVVVPKLTEHVSRKLQADSQFLKERRKLEEAKKQAKGDGPKGRGRGRGDGASDKFFMSLRVEMEEDVTFFLCLFYSDERINKAISALNSLFFGGGLGRARSTGSAGVCGNEAQASARELVIQQVKRLGPPPPDASGPGAICALRAASSSYVEPEPGTGEVVPMVLDRLSLPSGKVAGVDLASALEGHTRKMVMNFEDYLLQDATDMGDMCESAGSVKPYNDPVLRRHREYISFLGLLFKCGTLTFTQHCKGRVGAFCVSKKPKVIDGQVVERQRLVLDCRQVNLLFKPPPLTELGSLSALAELHLRDDQTLYVGGADIKDCFYACNFPTGMQDYFCLATDISFEEVAMISGGQFDTSQGVGRMWSPCISVLPMGFNWSFFLVQCLHEQSVCKTLGIGIIDGKNGEIKPTSRLSPSEQRECLVFAGIVPLLVGDMRPLRTSGDGRKGLDPFEDLATAGSLGPPDPLDCYVPNDGFPEVPAKLMHATCWRTVKMGRWGDTSEHITLKEARALCIAVRRLSRTTRNRSKRHLVIVDSLALAFSVTKGAKSVRVLSEAVLKSPFQRQRKPDPPPGSERAVKTLLPGERGVKRARQLSPSASTTPRLKKTRRQVNRIPIKDEKGAGKLAQEGGLTILERRSVSGEIEGQYTQHYEKFKAFCKENGGSWPPQLVDVDALLADYLDTLFLQGKSASEGEKAVAALEFLHIGAKNKAPRSRRALKGWRKEVPPGSRLPLPKLAMYGIAMLLYYRGRRLMALKVEPVYQTYSIVIRDLEDGRPDKIGVYDNSLPLDNPETSWIGPHLHQRASSMKKKTDFLYDFSMEEFRKSFGDAASKLGLGVVHPYQLRHGGAAEDLNSRFRDHNAVKSRGRWKTDQSVRRYTKIGKIQQLLSKLGPDQLSFCKRSAALLPKVFSGKA